MFVLGWHCQFPENNMKKLLWFSVLQPIISLVNMKKWHYTQIVHSVHLSVVNLIPGSFYNGVLVTYCINVSEVEDTEDWDERVPDMTDLYDTLVKDCTWVTLLILWKYSLYSDVQQFHQYQGNEQSPLT